MLKKSCIVLSSMMLSGLALSQGVQACSHFSWSTQDHGVYIARTFDWMESGHPVAVYQPAGSAFVHDDIDVSTRYGYFATVIFGDHVTSGVNTKKLSVDTLYLPGTETPDQQEGKHKLAISKLEEYFLGQFDSVSDALKGLNKLNVYVDVTPSLNTGADNHLTVHFALADGRGDNAVIEFTDGKVKVWHGQEYHVVTNNPVYDQQLADWKKLQAQYGDVSTWTEDVKVPGNISGSDRFLLNSYRMVQLKEPASYVNGHVKAMSAITLSPQDSAHHAVNGKSFSYPSEYAITYSLDNDDAYIRYQMNDALTQYHINIGQLEKNNKAVSLDMTDPELAGDVTDQFHS
ncbi:Choloylglycine hydrolase [invertebrate metagenome]|uniref:Choloylglycine hydrolase n=1 Tax=invertebrate metagenome TaxID=1711999 RepID=A0A2H9T3S4_9ZZZZ